jgi:hypothetical protein
LIGRGQLWTSLDSLESETGLSKKQIRTALDKLKETSEVASQGQATGRMITVLNYDLYQEEGKPEGSLGAGEGQAKGKGGAANKNVNNEKNDEEPKEPPPPPKPEWTPPEGLNLEAWDLFTAHRKEIKKPLKTDNMKNGQSNKIKDLAPDQQMAVVQLSLDGGWTGLFPEKITTPQSNSFNQPAQQEGAKFRPYVHEETERTQPPEGMMDSWRKLL